MSERSVRRALLRIGALTTAVVLAFGGSTAGALAQEPETPTSSVAPTPTSEPTTPPSTQEPIPSSEPAPPSPTPSTESSAPAEPSTPTTPAKPTAPTTPSTPDTKPAEEQQAAPPQPAAQADEKRPDLSVSVVPDKAEFLPAEDIGLTITVRNKGETPAANIRFGHESTQAWLVAGAGELSSRPSLVPGQEKVLRVVLRPTDATSDSVPFLFRATVDGVGDPTPGDNGTSLYLKVRQLKGSVSGVLYLDKNGSGSFDEGEGLPNISINTKGGTPPDSDWAYTDATGAFRMYSVVAGKHTVWSVDNNNKYAVQQGFADFVVEHEKETKLMLPVVAPVSATLTATMAFDKASYHVTDKVGLSITLKNSGTQPINRVVAVCIGYSPEFLDSDNFSQLRPDGEGVTVPAGGETKVFVTTDMPKVTNPWIYANCWFGNNGRNTNGSLWVGNVSAKVHGLHGDYSGRVVNAQTGEPVPHARVNVLDPVTRQPLKDVISADYNGNLRIYSLSPGKIVLQIAGKWKPQDGNEFVVDIIADTTTSLDLKVVPGDVEVPDVGHRPDLAITAKFDKDTYDIAEPMRVNVTVKNIGTGREAAVRLETDYTPPNARTLEFDRSQFGDLGDATKKVFLRPGESRELTLVGKAPYFMGDEDEVSLGLRVSTPIDHGPANNSALVTASVTYVSGDAAVVLYADSNKNKRKDADEQVFPNTRVYVNGGNRPYKSAEAMTDASGRAVFSELPVGLFQVYGSYPDGWVRPGYDQMTVSADAETVLEIGAERPLSDKFFATLNFLKNEYAAGENYEAEITLENRTGEDMPSVKAFCSGPGEPGEISNVGPGWGPLAWDGAGVSVPDGEKRSFRVSGPLPEEAPRIGYATIGCYFGSDPSTPGTPSAGDSFRVPGLRADAIGKLVKDNPAGGQEIPEPKATVVLLDPETKKVVARTISDAEGRFGFTNLPVGRYDVVVPGPWKVEIRRMNPFFHVRVGSETWEQIFHLVPGPVVEDPGYPLPEDEIPGTNTPPAPAGGGGTGEALAKTGASVLGLGLVGALLVAFGFGASLIGRRRTA